MTLAYPPNFTTLANLAPDPVEQGARAYSDGQSVEANPHPIPGRRADGWNVGWCETCQEVEGAEPEFELGGEG